jgi:hypothetical protein
MIKIEDDMRCGSRRIRVSDDGVPLQRYEAIDRLELFMRSSASDQIEHLKKIERIHPSRPRSKDMKHDKEKLRIFGSRILAWIAKKLGYKPPTEQEERERPGGWS